MKIDAKQDVFLKVKDSNNTATIDWPFAAIPQMGDRVVVKGVSYRVINRSFHLPNEEIPDPYSRINIWVEPYK